MVVVHGETVVEPVEPGTNRAAIECDDVDLLAHPGLISAEDAARAAERGCFVEVSARRGHALANGHVVRTALAAGAKLIVNSDGHAPGDLLTPQLARFVLLGAATPESELPTILDTNPRALLKRLGLK
jgi:histidinol phosphatase-like PHP family hydrolase